MFISHLRQFQLYTLQRLRQQEATGAVLGILPEDAASVEVLLDEPYIPEFVYPDSVFRPSNLESVNLKLQSQVPGIGETDLRNAHAPKSPDSSGIIEALRWRPPVNYFSVLPLELLEEIFCSLSGAQLASVAKVRECSSFVLVLLLCVFFLFVCALKGYHAAAFVRVLFVVVVVVGGSFRKVMLLPRPSICLYALVVMSVRVHLCVAV